VNPPRLLLTGSSGWLGSQLATSLRWAGFEVVGLSRAGGAGAIRGDLLDPAGWVDALRERGPFAAVVHAAVQPHRFVDSLRRREETSPELVAGLLAAWQDAFGAASTAGVHGIMLSTVSVYGEADREGLIGPEAELRPPTAYGKGKVVAERRWQAAGWGRATILRVGPVIARDRLRNAKVRSYLPGVKLRLHLRPEPKFSLCSMETLQDRVRQRLQEGMAGPSGPENLVDTAAWTSSMVDIAFGFGGPRVVLPAALPRAILRLLKALPATYGLRCLLAKRASDIVYR